MTQHIHTNSAAESGSSKARELADLIRRVESITWAGLQTSQSGNSFPNGQGPVLDQDGNAAKEYEKLLNGGGLSEEGLGLDGFSSAVNLLSQHSVDNTSPGFLGKLVSAPSPPGIAADLFLSILNNNGHVWRASPALTAVEKHVTVELAKHFNLQGQHAGGITVPGGAAGNFLAFLAARNILHPKSKTQGTTPGKYAIFVSDQAHYSATNAAQMIGLGNDSVIRVPTLLDGTMDTALLEAAVQDTIKEERRPLLVVATSGNTVNGGFDPLDKIGEIARKANAWFHVDACWGGAVVFSDKLKHLMRGSELADSIAFNPHKMLGVPLVCAFLLVNDIRALWLANKLEAGYLFHDKSSGKANGVVKSKEQQASVNGVNSSEAEYDWRMSSALDAAPEFAEIRDMAALTVQCSRRSDATKMFLHWIYYGTKGMARDVEQAVDSAQHLARLIEAHPRLELLGEQEKTFAQVCFYWKSETQPGSNSLDGQALANFNSRNTQQLYQGLSQSGWKIDYAPDKTKGEFVRIACNRLTTRQGVELLITKLVELGLSLNL